MKAPKKPKAKALPKRPKASASLTVWENYKKKCDEVRKNNKKAIEDWKKSVARLKSEAKKKEGIQKATQGLGRI